MRRKKYILCETQIRMEEGPEDEEWPADVALRLLPDGNLYLKFFFRVSPSHWAELTMPSTFVDWCLQCDDERRDYDDWRAEGIKIVNFNPYALPLAGGVPVIVWDGDNLLFSLPVLAAWLHPASSPVKVKVDRGAFVVFLRAHRAVAALPKETK